MDEIDKKILIELVQNSKIPISQLAKKIKVSRDIASYRLNKLKSTGIIRDYITEIDINKLGYKSALLFIIIESKVEEEFIEYINSQDFISWTSTLNGFWNFGMAIYGKTLEEIDERYHEILKKYGKYISKDIFQIYKNISFYNERLFNIKIKTKKEMKPVPHKLDNIDRIILNKLSKNSRITSVELAREISLTAVAITNRIKVLEKSQIITKSTIYINLRKLNLFEYYYFISNMNSQNRLKLNSFLKSHPKICSVITYIGDPFIEFGIFVDSPYKVRAIVQEILELFPENKVVDFFLVQEEYLSYGFPSCVFELEDIN